MHHRIDTILKRIRQDVAGCLEPESIRSACRDAGHPWRDRRLNPVAIIHRFLIQILHGNTSIEHVALLGGGRFTGAAYCLARSDLPRLVFQKVLANLVKTLIPITETEGRRLGHRTCLIDGSSFSMPDTLELQAHFGQPGNQAKGCGFPVAHILALFHSGTGLLLDVAAAPLRTHDMSGIMGILPLLKAKDVLVADRGFCSFSHLALLMSRGVDAVFRLHQKQIADFTPGRAHADRRHKKGPKGLPTSRWIRNVGVLDQVVEYVKPKERPRWMSAEDYAALPETITVRELRYRIEAPGFRTHEITLVTTLLAAEEFPTDELAELYATRWKVEGYLKSLKQTMEMDVLKCKTVEGVLKELTVYAMAYNLVRAAMCQAAARQGEEVDRISFIDALRWLRQPEDGEETPKLVVNRSRPGRHEPRVRKRRPKQYPVMKKSRDELRKTLRDKDLAA